MLPAISEWIGSNQVATVCCLDTGQPYCFNCFYAFQPSSGSLLFKSSPDAFHSALLDAGNRVAGTILPASINFSAIQGIQFTGRIDPSASEEAEEWYHRRFPCAESLPGKVYRIRLTTVKMTDNTISFGKKLNWKAATET